LSHKQNRPASVGFTPISYLRYWGPFPSTPLGPGPLILRRPSLLKILHSPLLRNTQVLLASRQNSLCSSCSILVVVVVVIVQGVSEHLAIEFCCSAKYLRNTNCCNSLFCGINYHSSQNSIRHMSTLRQLVINHLQNSYLSLSHYSFTGSPPGAAHSSRRRYP